MCIGAQISQPTYRFGIPAPGVEANKAVNLDLKKAAGTAFAAFTIGSSVLNSPIANAVDVQPFAFSSTNIVAEKVVRQGLYSDYEVDIVQERDDARSTFKGAAETKSKKGKYTAILAILIVGSFIVPMAQYFWYVKDDDSSDRFFGTKGMLRLLSMLVLCMSGVITIVPD
jgi:phosphotransferase system  glucose/maltose/N-acetylglucosamine-specific IIC component